MATYNGNSRFYNCYRYWQKCPEKYNFVGLLEQKTSNGFIFTGSVFRSVSGASAQKQLNGYKHSSQYRTWFMTREQYNSLLTMVKNDAISEDYNMETLMSSTYLPAATGRPAIAGKMVHVSWNITTGQPIWADEAQDICVKKCQEAARQNPTHEFAVLSPVKKIFQPINITTEDVK